MLCVRPHLIGRDTSEQEHQRPLEVGVVGAAPRVAHERTEGGLKLANCNPVAGSQGIPQLGAGAVVVRQAERVVAVDRLRPEQGVRGDQVNEVTWRLR